jgi:hypothetical protein
MPRNRGNLFEVKNQFLELAPSFAGCARVGPVGLDSSRRMIQTSRNLNLVACRSEFVTADPAGGVRVFPSDWPSIGGVGVAVASEFASQVGNRAEDAARDDVAFDLS